MFASFTPGFGKRVKLRLKGERALNEVFTAYLCDTCSSCRWFFLFLSAQYGWESCFKTPCYVLCNWLTQAHGDNNFLRDPDAGHVTYALHNSSCGWFCGQGPSALLYTVSFCGRFWLDKLLHTACVVQFGVSFLILFKDCITFPRIGMIMRIRHLLPLHAKLTLYNCLIIPLFDYGDTV